MTIEIPLIEHPSQFPDPNQALAEPNGLLGYGYLLSNELLIKAYYEGIFPWFNPGEPVFWWSPDPRAAFDPKTTTPSKSLRKKLRQTPFVIKVNAQFEQVIDECAKATSKRPETWITPEMRLAYRQLHQHGYAHSFEVYQDQQLVGGLYGVAHGALFFGESMFHIATDASKIALFYLLAFTRHHGFQLVDCQLPNPHLKSLGAKEVSRKDFLSYLYQYRDVEMPASIWQTQDITHNFLF